MMKLFRNRISLLHSILIIAPLFFGCGGRVKEENKNNASAISVSSSDVANEKYGIDKRESVVTWKGSKVFAPEQAHRGYVYISKGELMIEKGRLVGGAVEIDMNTITDPVHGSDNNLINHLKDPDFFDVKKFPIATFVITRVASVNAENVNVTGNLTIKDITHAVTFPVKIEVKGKIVNATGKVTIDRTKWDVRYNSGKFYDNLADKAISDDIEFDMKIVATKE
jgi:polyisoprenoid-binding protein YceI